MYKLPTENLYFNLKKLLGIVVLVLVWCNISTAAIYKGESSEAKEREKDCLASGKTKSACKKELYGWDLNEYLKDGYKITSEELVKMLIQQEAIRQQLQEFKNSFGDIVAV